MTRATSEPNHMTILRPDSCWKSSLGRSRGMQEAAAYM
jgi:hypothetical protein